MEIKTATIQLTTYAKLKITYSYTVIEEKVPNSGMRDTYDIHKYEEIEDILEAELVMNDWHHKIDLDQPEAMDMINKTLEDLC